MDALHPTMGIRVCGLAPGAFQTPLWSEEKKSWMENSEWLPLSEVADGMIRCIEDEDVKGGEILEVLTGKTRILPLGGPLPHGAGIISLAITANSRCGTGRRGRREGSRTSRAISERREGPILVERRHQIYQSRYYNSIVYVDC